MTEYSDCPDRIAGLGALRKKPVFSNGLKSMQFLSNCTVENVCLRKLLLTDDMLKICTFFRKARPPIVPGEPQSPCKRTSTEVTLPALKKFCDSISSLGARDKARSTRLIRASRCFGSAKFNRSSGPMSNTSLGNAWPLF